MRKQAEHIGYKIVCLPGYSKVSVIESDYQIGGGDRMSIKRIDAATLELAELWSDINGTTVEEELEIELQLAE